MEFEQLKNLKKGTKFIFIYKGGANNVIIGRVSKISPHPHYLSYTNALHSSCDLSEKKMGMSISRQINRGQIPFNTETAKRYHTDQKKFREGKSIILHDIFNSESVKFGL